MDTHVIKSLIESRAIVAEVGDQVKGLEVLQRYNRQYLLNTQPTDLPVFNGYFNLVPTRKFGSATTRVAALTKTGVVYAYFSHYITKSEDWGETWSDFLTDVNDLPQTVRQIGCLDSGELIVACTGGYVYKSDENQENWRLVLDMTDGQPMQDMGFQIYGDMVLLGTYGDGLTTVTAYLSLDRGETFEPILVLPGDGGLGPDPIKHIHDIKFDPYEGLIWVTTGDDYGEANSTKNRIYVSVDLGNTWRHYRGYRAAQIMPLPGCVLFAGDNRRRVSVARFDRPLAGTASLTDLAPIRDDWPTSNEWPIKETWFAAMIPDEDTSGYWGTNAAVTYGPDALAVFSFRHGPNNPQPLKIWATKDGMRISTVWTSSWLGGFVGGVFGPDNEGNYAAAVNDGETNYLLKLNFSAI